MFVILVSRFVIKNAMPCLYSEGTEYFRSRNKGERKVSCNSTSNLIIERAVMLWRMTLWRILSNAVLFAMVMLYNFSASLHLMGNLVMRGKQIEGSMLC